MNRVVHFEIHADDPERATKFYTDVFGWDIKKWEGGEFPYWIIMTGPDYDPKNTKDFQPGINGGIFPRRGSINGTQS